MDRAGIARWYSAGLRAGWLGGSSPCRGWGIFLFDHRAQTGSGAHPAYYPIDTFPWGKAVGALSWPLTSI
jgi:hypothetical protein